MRRDTFVMIFYQKSPFSIRSRNVAEVVMVNGVERCVSVITWSIMFHFSVQLNLNDNKIFNDVKI